MLVSAGFDAHWDDPLASMCLSLTGYNHLDRELIAMANELCEGKIIFMLEGGYNTDTLAYGIGNIAYALLAEDTCQDPFGTVEARTADIDTLIQHIKHLHSLK